MKPVERKILLNPGPATTTDTVKYAQIVPDICPREKEFSGLMKGLQEGLLNIVHADKKEYEAVLFCGSGTLCMDVCLNSLVPKDRKVLIIDNGAYSARAAEICGYYHIPFVHLSFPVDELPDMAQVEKALNENPDVAVVYSTHNETGTGILNPVREIGEMAHRHGAVSVVDTTSTYAMRPINVYDDNIDFCMASAQKGLMGMTGLSYVIGRREAIEASADYPTRSYYCNLFLQYSYFKKTGEMHFTPPVQTIYAAIQALKEYNEEGEQRKWERHLRVHQAILQGIDRLGFHDVIKRDQSSVIKGCIPFALGTCGKCLKLIGFATPPCCSHLRIIDSVHIRQIAYFIHKLRVVICTDLNLRSVKFPHVSASFLSRRYMEIVCIHDTVRT